MVLCAPCTAFFRRPIAAGAAFSLPGNIDASDTEDFSAELQAWVDGLFECLDDSGVTETTDGADSAADTTDATDDTDLVDHHRGHIDLHAIDNGALQDQSPPGSSNFHGCSEAQRAAGLDGVEAQVVDALADPFNVTVAPWKTTWSGPAFEIGAEFASAPW
mgnify:CR=1 FL=1